MKHALVLIAILFSVILLPTCLQAQGNFEDVVYLKNGSIVHGLIIEQIPNESIKIRTHDLNVYVYKLDEVSKITKEEIPAPVVRRQPRSSFRSESATDDNIKKSGYTNITEFNFAAIIGNDPTKDLNSSDELENITRGLSFGVQSINGYQFLPYVSAGVGVGLQLHTTMLLVPLFADVHLNFMAKRLTPFVSIAAGYALTPRELFGFNNIALGNKGGLLFSPAAGVKFFVKPKFALNLSLGYRYQEVELYHEYYYSNGSNYSDSYSNEALRLFNLRFGFTF